MNIIIKCLLFPESFNSLNQFLRGLGFQPFYDFDFVVFGVYQDYRREIAQLVLFGKFEMPLGVLFVYGVAGALEVRHYDAQFFFRVFCEFVGVYHKFMQHFAGRAPVEAGEFEHQRFALFLCGFISLVEIGFRFEQGGL